MPPDADNCPNPNCREPIRYWQVQCRCGEFLGFPNYRAAAGHREESLKRSRAARDDAETPKVAPFLAKHEALAGRYRPAIAMPFAVSDDILRSGKYSNYGKRIESGEREPASAPNHAGRDIVGAK